MSGPLLAVLGVLAVVVSCGSTSRFDFSAVVPENVQRKIAELHPQLAYFPTAVPTFSDAPGTFILEFSGPGGADALSFGVARLAHSRCPSAAMHTFQVDGIRVRWAGTVEDQHAWRCIRRDHVTVGVSASRSVFGDNQLNTPFRRIDALILARMVAHVRYIG